MDFFDRLLIAFFVVILFGFSLSSHWINRSRIMALKARIEAVEKSEFADW